MSALPPDFYNRPSLSVARELLGARLVRVEHEFCISGYITETEAYIGETDLACHARAGRTKRTDPMYGSAGQAYVYFTYGNHWMLNAVTEQEGFPAAVLIRAIIVSEGLDVIAQRRGHRPQAEWTNGPGKLTQALHITGAENYGALHNPKSGLWIESGITIPDKNVTTSPRVGLNSVPEPWKSIPWRFLATLGDQK